MNPKNVICAKFLITKLYGKTSHKVTYTRKEYKVNSDGLQKKIGRFWPRHIEYYCNQNMLGFLRLILMAENYHEIDMEDAHYQIITGIYLNAPAIYKYHTERKTIRRELREMSGVSEYSSKNLFIRIFFGGSIEEWRKYNIISIETTLPPFVYELEREIAEIQANFLNNGNNIQFVNATKYKKEKERSKTSYENSAFALCLQHLESICMLECMKYLKQKMVEYSAFIHDGSSFTTTSRARLM